MNVAKILALTLAILPVGILPQVVQPANAQLTIQFGGNRHRRPVYTRPLQRRVFVPQRRIVRQRQWVRDRWENRWEKNRYRRVWVPGYYR